MFGRKNPVFFCKQKSDMSNGPFICHVPEIKLQYIFYTFITGQQKKYAFIFHKKCLKKLNKTSIKHDKKTNSDV